MYRVIKDFKGSPDGCRVIEFTEGQILTIGEDFSNSLMEAVVVEGWVVAHDQKPAPAKKSAKKKAKK